MRNFFTLVFIIFWLGTLTGCVSNKPTSTPISDVDLVATIFVAATLSAIPPTPAPESTPSSNAILLEINGETIALEFLQNGISVPVEGKPKQLNLTLKPEPFTLMVHGNKDIISVMALKSIDMALPLQNVSGPLVTLSGMGNMFWEHNLFLFDKPSDIKIYDPAAFFKEPLFKPNEATELSAYLKNKFGTEPTIFATGRTYLGIERGGEPNYLITKVSNKTIGDYVQSGNSMALVVFAQKDLGKDFFQVNWVIFNLKFQ